MSWNQRISNDLIQLATFSLKLILLIAYLLTLTLTQINRTHNLKNTHFMCKPVHIKLMQIFSKGV